MTRKNSNISKEKIERYLKNQMSAQERNAFEKELERNPFEKDAVEGFSTLAPNELYAQLNSLKTIIHTPKKKKPRMLAAAAVILLLISSGILLNQLNQNKPINNIADSGVEEKGIDLHEESAETKLKPSLKKQERQKEIPLNKEAPKPEKPEETESANPIRVQNNKGLKANAQPKSLTDNQTSSVEEVESSELPGEAIPLAPVENRIAGSESDEQSSNENIREAENESYAQQATRSIRGKVISEKDSQPIPGVSLVQSGTRQGTVSDIDGKFNLELANDTAPITTQFIGMEKSEFQPNINEEVLISLQEQNTELNEVVTIGYGTQKKSAVKSTSKKVTSDFNSAPQPIGGMEDYENYLKRNATLPNNYPRNKETVKVLLKISDEGGITEIINKNKADSTMLKIAQQIISDGPSWQPERINGEAQESEFLLKIVFRKLK